MLKRLTFGPLEPDKPLSQGRASNVWPLTEGFRPVRAFQAMTPPLPGLLGGCAYVSSNGTATLYGATAATISYYDGAAWQAVLSGFGAARWQFDQFGDLVIAVHGGVPVRINMASGEAANLPGSPPPSSIVATVRQQAWLAGDPLNRNTLAISSYNNVEGWTAGDNQCLYVPFPNGGDITGLVGGETGIILQKRSIKRGTYNGDGVTWWTFDEISADTGCMSPGSVAHDGNMIFFLSEEGFKACDRSSVIPIGLEKIDREFFNTYSRADIENIQSAIDPRSTTVIWGMPGNPGRLWCYNWSLGQWTTIDTPMATIFSGFTSNTSIDVLDARYPGGLDAMSFSLDAEFLAGGNPLFLVATNTGALGTLSGANMAASFTMKPIEMEPGSRVRIRGANVITDAITGTVTADARARAGDPARRVTSGTIRNNGAVSLRSNGRHIGLTVDIPGGAPWSYALGLDVEYEREGAR